MNAQRLLPLALPLTLVLAAPGCIITDGGDDSGGDVGDSNDDGPGGTGPADTGSAEGADTDAADETGPGGTADAPTPGTWLYEETGVVSNGCAFLDDPSNGWGTYLVVAASGGFMVVPGDGTDPFDCTSGAGSFECPERLEEEMQEEDTTLQVYVTIVGTLPSASMMVGTQQGEVSCQGANCALVEQAFGTTFPCEFAVGFTGELVG